MLLSSTTLLRCLRDIFILSKKKKIRNHFLCARLSNGELLCKKKDLKKKDLIGEAAPMLCIAQTPRHG